MKNPLLDKDFLRSLDQEKEREIYARVISLNMKEEPMEEITGKVTSGSVNIDGNSAVRRTCSLSLIAEEFNIHDYYWGMNTKFQLEIGMKNNINKEYEDIIWFPQGVFLISSFNTSQAINNYSVSIQGRDKMAMLNGDVGGVITALSHDFGQVDVQQADGSYVTQSLLLRDIIQSAVHTFAKEPFHNIIINDLDDYGVELMEYRGDTPLYLLVNKATQEVSNTRVGRKDHTRFKREYYYKNYNPATNNYDEWSKQRISIDENLQEDKIIDIIYDNRIDYLNVPNYPTILGAYTVDKQMIEYTVIKIEYGMTIGYRMTDLTFAGDLIIQVGGTITQMLDKIKDMLGEFEYFYDLQGHFVFQRKKTYLNTSWNNIVENKDSETYVDNLTDSSSTLYNFENSNLITTFQNNPNLSNLKNDFSIWGTRISVTGAEIPIHLRYAIDSKPQYYTSLDGTIYTTRSKEEVELDKENFENGSIDAKEGYKKEPSKFGLSEDWWEVRDWAKAWEFSGLPIPTEALSRYCPIRSYVRKEGAEAPETSETKEITFIPAEEFEKWGKFTYSSAVDDLIFHGDGTYWTTHGGCAHSYSQWLDYFAEGGDYEGGYAYFYKPQVPTDVIEDNGGQGLIIGEQIVYNLDWRELIYQMAVDYMNRGSDDDFLLRLGEKNVSFYPTGITGYEQYYTDILGFWRGIYNPEYIHTFDTIQLTKSQFEKGEGKTYWTPIQCTADFPYNVACQFVKKNGYQDYEFIKFTKKGWENVVDKTQYYNLQIAKNYQYDAVYYIEINDEFDAKTYWSKTALTNPELLNFWFDFLDTRDGSLSLFSVHNIGNRPKAENDNNVKAIYYRDTPNVIVVNPITLKVQERAKILQAYETEKAWENAIAKDYSIDINDSVAISAKKDMLINTMVDMRIAEIKALQPGYTIIRLNSAIENLFSISAQGKSAYDVLNNNIYNYAHCADTITINALPIYYLEPNTRISVKDIKSGIEGEYIINKITLPLQHSGMMSISATKAVERLF